MSTSQDIFFAILVTLIAGLATSLGALISFIIPLHWTRVLPMALAFSAGVMIYISFIEILPECHSDFSDNLPQTTNIEFKSHLFTSITFFSGIIMGYIIDFIVHKLGYNDDNFYKNGIKLKESKPLISKENISMKYISKKKRKNNNISIDNNRENSISKSNFGYELNPIYLTNDYSGDGVNPTTHNTSLVVYKNSNDDSNDVDDDGGIEIVGENEKLNRLSLITAFSIAFHNFPEGIATFFATLSDPKLGVGLAVAIALHNIPEGISVAMPMYYSTGKKCKGFILATISGIFEPIGGIIGYALVNTMFGNNYEFAIMLGICSGIMIYISFKELLPISRLKDPNDKFTTILLFAGFLLMDISLIVFKTI